MRAFAALLLFAATPAFAAAGEDQGQSTREVLAGVKSHQSVASR